MQLSGKGVCIIQNADIVIDCKSSFIVCHLLNFEDNGFVVFMRINSETTQLATPLRLQTLKSMFQIHLAPTIHCRLTTGHDKQDRKMVLWKSPEKHAAHTVKDRSTQLVVVVNCDSLFSASNLPPSQAFLRPKHQPWTMLYSKT